MSDLWAQLKNPAGHNESYENVERLSCCLWFHESQSPTSVQRKFRTNYPKNHPEEWVF